MKIYDVDKEEWVDGKVEDLIPNSIYAVTDDDDVKYKRGIYVSLTSKYLPELPMTKNHNVHEKGSEIILPIYPSMDAFTASVLVNKMYGKGLYLFPSEQYELFGEGTCEDTYGFENLHYETLYETKLQEILNYIVALSEVCKELWYSSTRK